MSEHPDFANTVAARIVSPPKHEFFLVQLPLQTCCISAHHNAASADACHAAKLSTPHQCSGWVLNLGTHRRCIQSCPVSGCVTCWRLCNCTSLFLSATAVPNRAQATYQDTFTFSITGLTLLLHIALLHGVTPHAAAPRPVAIGRHSSPLG
jgi:hypothetical protein